jgi:hypothetical protein
MKTLNHFAKDAKTIVLEKKQLIKVHGGEDIQEKTKHDTVKNSISN